MASIVMSRGSEKVLIDSTLQASYQANGWKLAEVVATQYDAAFPKGTMCNYNRYGARVTGLTPMMGAHYQIAPALGSATAVHAAIAMTATAQTVVTGFVQPDVPRLVSIKGNAVGNAGNVTIYGTNILGEAIREVIALNGATEVAGTLAFKTVTAVDLPAETHGGSDTTSIGSRNVFGIPHIVDNASLLLLKLFNGSADTGTLAVDANLVEKNLFSINGTPDGTKVLDLFYLAANA